MASEVKEAFVRRPHLVDSADGFIRMEVVSPCDQPDEFWLMTYWSDVPSYKKWHASAAHHESHRGIPKGLKLDPTATEVRIFSHISS